MKYIIIDDEHYAHQIIKSYGDQIPNLVFIESCYDAIEALNVIKTGQIDLIFLDLNMPKLNGFDFLKTLSNPPKVIVTTAYKEYAIDGYELNIIDYLLKPISFDRFIKAINKIEIKNEKLISNSEGTPKSDDKSIFFKSNKNYFKIDLINILFIESQSNYCKIVTESKQVVVREKISSLIELLPSNNFYQVHKSFIISKKHIDSIQGNRIFINNNIIPIGKQFKINVLNIIESK